MALSRTARYYRANPEAAEKHRAYQRKLNKEEGQSEYRSDCNKARELLGLKVGDKRDASHTKDGKVVAEDRKKNRARNGADGKSTKK